MLVPLELEVVAALAHQVPVPPGRLSGVFQPVLGDESGHLRGGAPGQDDQALVVLLQQLPVHPGLVVVALQVGLADQADQVLVPGVVPGQHGEVKGAALGLGLGVAAALGHVHLAADDRLDPRLAALGVELHDTVQRAVVGDGQRLHAELLGSADQMRDAADPVEKAVFGVHVEVSEHQLP